MQADEGVRARSLASPRAAHTGQTSDLGLDVTVGTTLPLATQLRVGLEVPGHLVLQVTAGLVPSFLVDAINDVGTGWGAWAEQDARVVSGLLAEATWLEVGAAIRPAGTPGIELGVAYVLLWTHRTLSAEGWLGSAALGDVSLDVYVHAVRGELAWQTVVAGPLYFRIAVGWVHGLAHGVSILVDGDEGLRTTAAGVSASLATELGTRAFGPTLGTALGLRI